VFIYWARGKLSYSYCNILDELVHIFVPHVSIHERKITAHGQQDVVSSVNVILLLTIVEEIRHLVKSLPFSLVQYILCVKKCK